MEYKIVTFFCLSKMWITEKNVLDISNVVMKTHTNMHTCILKLYNNVPLKS